MKKIKNTQNALYDAIEAFQNGDSNKATLIYKISKQYSYNIIYRQVSRFVEQDVITGDIKSITEDIMQDLYMEFFKTIATFRNEDPNSFYKWIVTVANRMVLRYVDKNKREILRFDSEYDVDDIDELNDEQEYVSYYVPDSALETKEFQRMMKKFVKSLPEEQAQTIIYHIYGGMKYREIAELMGVSLITVKTRMRKAKEALREKVNAYEKKTGTRLGVIAPIPLIAFYLQIYMEQVKMPFGIDFRLFNQIRKKFEESVPVLIRYLEAFLQMQGMKELVVGVVVATLIGTGTAGVIQEHLPTIPEPPVIEDKEQDEKKEEEIPQESMVPSLENQKYFIYWDSKSIDVSDYVYEGEYYEDPTYGKIKKWLVCEEALLKLPLTKKESGGNTVYCYDDGKDRYEFAFHGPNSYSINGYAYTYEMEMEVIDGKKYINPYHLYKNMFGMTNFIVGSSYGSNFVAIKTTQYQVANEQNSEQNNEQNESNVIMDYISNTIPPQGGYKNGDVHASSRFRSIADGLKSEKGGASLKADETSLNYFDSIYVSYMNDDGSWMYLRVAKWTTNAKITDNLEDQVYMSLGSTLYTVMGTICGAGGDTGMQLYQTVVKLLGQYYHPENVPTQGIVEEDVPGLYVTLTQSPEGLEIRYFAE